MYTKMHRTCLQCVPVVVPSNYSMVLLRAFVYLDHLAPNLTTETNANELNLGRLAASHWWVKLCSLHLISPKYSLNGFGSEDVKLAQDFQDPVLKRCLQSVDLCDITVVRYNFIFPGP